MWQLWVRGKTHTNFRWGNLTLKRPLGRPGCRRDNNIKLDCKRMGWRGVWQLWVRGKIHTKFRCGNLTLKRPLGRPGFRRDNNIKVDRKRVGWIYMPQNMDM